MSKTIQEMVAELTAKLEADPKYQEVKAALDKIAAEREKTAAETTETTE